MAKYVVYLAGGGLKYGPVNVKVREIESGPDAEGKVVPARYSSSSTLSVVPLALVDDPNAVDVDSLNAAIRGRYVELEAPAKEVYAAARLAAAGQAMKDVLGELFGEKIAAALAEKSKSESDE